MEGVLFSLSPFNATWMSVLMLVLTMTISFCALVYPNIFMVSFSNYFSTVRRAYSVNLYSNNFLVVILNIFYYIVFSLALYLFFRWHTDVQFLGFVFTFACVCIYSLFRLGVIRFILYIFTVKPSFSLYRIHYFYHCTILAIALFLLLFFAYFFSVNHALRICFFVLLGIHFLSLFVTLFRSLPFSFFAVFGTLVYLFTFEMLPIYFLWRYIPEVYFI